MMKIKNKKTPIKTNLEAIYKVAKKSLSEDDRNFLLTELDAMVQTLEDWKENNPEINEKRKAS